MNSWLHYECGASRPDAGAAVSGQAPIGLVCGVALMLAAIRRKNRLRLLRVEVRLRHGCAPPMSPLDIVAGARVYRAIDWFGHRPGLGALIPVACAVQAGRRCCGRAQGCCSRISAGGNCPYFARDRPR